jgi:hypothetical protein
MNASRCVARREPCLAHTRSTLVCGVSWARPPVSLGLLWGGSASAVFSAARFRFPFESLSYIIYEYGIGALLDLSRPLPNAASGRRPTQPAVPELHGDAEPPSDRHRVLRWLRLQALCRRLDGGFENLWRRCQGHKPSRPHFIVRSHRQRQARPLQADDGPRQVQHRQGEDGRARSR